MQSCRTISGIVRLSQQRFSVFVSVIIVNVLVNIIIVSVLLSVTASM